MLLELRAITYGREHWMPKETVKRPAIHRVITRGRDCMQRGFGSPGRKFTLLQCGLPTSTSRSQLFVAMGIPKQGLNMSTIAIDNFIFHPFLMHGSLTASHLQPDVARWPVKSGQHKPSIIAEWYHST